MKISGKKIDRVSEKIIPILRGDKDAIILTVRSLDSWKEFDELCPKPEPPMIKRVGETVSTPNFNDKGYQEAINEYATRRVAFLVIKGLEATENLEWETVNIKDPTTYKYYLDELIESGLTDIEVGRIVDTVMEVNGLNEEKIEEAKKRFLLQAREVKSPSTSPVEQ